MKKYLALRSLFLHQLSSHQRGTCTAKTSLIAFSASTLQLCKVGLSKTAKYRQTARFSDRGHKNRSEQGGGPKLFLQVLLPFPSVQPACKVRASKQLDARDPLVRATSRSIVGRTLTPLTIFCTWFGLKSVGVCWISRLFSKCTALSVVLAFSPSCWVCLW